MKVAYDWVRHVTFMHRQKGGDLKLTNILFDSCFSPDIKWISLHDTFLLLFPSSS